MQILIYVPARYARSDIFAYKTMVLIVNFYQTPAVWLLGHFGKSDRSPSDRVLALGLAERIRDLVAMSAPGPCAAAQTGPSDTRVKGSRAPCVAVVPR
jgi:hypothetical protein